MTISYDTLFPSAKTAARTLSVSILQELLNNGLIDFNLVIDLRSVIKNKDDLIEILELADDIFILSTGDDTVSLNPDIFIQPVENIKYNFDDEDMFDNSDAERISTIKELHDMVREVAKDGQRNEAFIEHELLTNFIPTGVKDTKNRTLKFDIDLNKVYRDTIGYLQYFDAQHFGVHWDFNDADKLVFHITVH